jgi:Zn-dependent protease with chaperone function
MPAVLNFLLECAAVALLAAMAGSVASLALARVLVPASQSWSAVRRADALFVVSILPAALTVLLVLSTATPSVLPMLGIGDDHCMLHGHHAHFCIVHSVDARPLMLALGFAWLSIFVARSASLAGSALRTSRDLRRLEALGSVRSGRFPSIVVPAPVCHAAGIFRRRMIVSDELERQLTAAELAAAQSHELAHLLRRDPTAIAAVRLAGLFAMPAVAKRLSLQFREAIEEAADAHAAAVTADAPAVASALVKVARLQRAIALPSMPAFGHEALEARVRRLLDVAPAVNGRPYALLYGSAAIGSAAVLAVLHSTALHHAVETALSHF